MTKAIVHSFKLKNAYKANSIIFSLKSIPLIKSLLPQSLYSSPLLKQFANVLGVISKIVSLFLGKALYMALIYWGAFDLTDSAGNSLINILFFLTLVGGIMNTHLFIPTRDKFYAIVLMRMSAREYTLTDYFTYIINTLIGFLPFSVIFGKLCGLNIFTCLLFPLFVVMVKFCFSALSIYKYRNLENVEKINSLTRPQALLVILLLAAALTPLFFRFAINELTFYISTALIFVPSIISLRYIIRFQNYRTVYKILLKPENFTSGGAKKAAALSQQATLQKKITSESVSATTSNKSGYKYFNEIFMKRHSTILTKSAIKITKIIGVIFAVLIACCFIWADAKSKINSTILTNMPYFLFIMYYINRGKVITQAMFMNCDHSMLAYRFFRQPKAIVSLFVERLKYVVLVNLIPAAAIGLGTPLLLYLSGGTDAPLNYLVLFLTIIAISVFFSVHNMVLYYLFQPYNIELETKSSLYNIVNMATYFLCYFAMGKSAPTLTFGIAVSAFCIIYAVIAVLLCYRFAPKTFKLRK